MNFTQKKIPFFPSSSGETTGTEVFLDDKKDPPQPFREKIRKMPIQRGSD